MPDLHGRPSKDKIRSQLKQAQSSWSNEQMAHSETRRKLERAQAEIEELQARLRFIEESARAILTCTAQPDASTIFERMKENRRKDIERMHAEIDAEVEARPQ